MLFQDIAPPLRSIADFRGGWPPPIPVPSHSPSRGRTPTPSPACLAAGRSPLGEWCARHLAGRRLRRGRAWRLWLDRRPRKHCRRRHALARQQHRVAGHGHSPTSAAAPGVTFPPSMGRPLERDSLGGGTQGREIHSSGRFTGNARLSATQIAAWHGHVCVRQSPRRAVPRRMHQEQVVLREVQVWRGNDGD